MADAETSNVVPISPEYAAHAAPPPHDAPAGGHDAGGHDAAQGAGHGADPGTEKVNKVLHPFKARAQNKEAKAQAALAGAAEPEPAPPPSMDKEHDRSEFVRDNSPSEAKVGFSPELMSSFETTVSKHVTKLLSLQEKNPKLLNDPQFKEDKLLVDHLTTNGTVDRVKVQRYLESTDGKKGAILLLENQARAMLQGMGLDIVAKAIDGKLPKEVVDKLFPTKGGDGERDPKGAIITSLAAGFGGATAGITLQEVIANGGEAFGGISDLFDKLGALGVGALTQLDQIPALLNNPVGAGAGGFAAGALANLGIRHIRHRGAEAKAGESPFEINIEGLDAIKANDSQVTYLAEMYGIHVNDFDTTTTPGTVTLKKPAGERRTVGTDRLIRDIHDILEVRGESLKALGYPDEVIAPGHKESRRSRRKKGQKEPNPNDQLFTRPNTDSREQFPTVWDEEIKKVYDSLVAAEVAGGKDPADVNSNEVFTKARAQVTMRHHERAIEQAGLVPQDSEKMVSNIRQVAEKIEGSAEENKKKSSEELARVNNDINHLTTTLDAQSRMEQHVKDMHASIDDFMTAFPGETDINAAINARTQRLQRDPVTHESHYDNQRRSFQRSNDDEVRSLRSGKARKRIQGEVRDRVMATAERFTKPEGDKGEKGGGKRDVAGELNNRIAAEVEREIESQVKRVEDATQRKLGEINQREARDQTEIKEMVEHRRRFIDKQELAHESETQLRVIEEMIESDYTELTDPSKADKIDPSKSTEVLVAGKKSTSERNRIINARIHHLREEFVRNSGLTPPDTTGMTPEDADKANARYEQQFMQLQSQGSKQAFERVRQELNRAHADLTEKSKTGELPEPEEKKVENAKLVLDLADTDKRNDRMARARTIDLSKFADRRKASEVDTPMSEAEKKLDAPMAYYAILEGIAGYETGHDMGGKHQSREEYFKKISAVLPPEKLAKLLFQSGFLGEPAEPVTDDNPATMDEVAETLNEAYGRNAFTQVQLRRMNRLLLRAIMEEVNATI